VPGPVALLALLAALLFSACSGSQEPYLESFEAPGSWTVGDDATAQGRVQDGVYQMSLEQSGASFWATAGQKLGDGRYELEARPLEGTADNGYGMIFRADVEQGDFYLFKVSSDGYAYIGRCRESCAEQVALVEADWFELEAINQGFDVTNRLRVDALGPSLTFYVNDAPAGAVEDATFRSGDIGLLAETFSPGGLTVQFDNFGVTPLVE
jgi:hypothetical protein